MPSHNDLINHLIDSNVLHSSNLIEAFRKIDRANFVSDTTLFDIYEDFPLQIGYGQTIEHYGFVFVPLIY